MKKFIAVMVVLIGLMTACDMEYGKAEEIEIGNVYDYDFENDIPEMKNIQEAYDYVTSKFEYIVDKKDYWQLPEETFNRRSIINKMLGDCEDSSIMLMYLLSNKLNIDSELVVVSITNSKTYHAIVYIPNVDLFYDTSFQNIWDIKKINKHFKIIESFSYSETLWMAYYYHHLIGI
jgi:hypothetical protein